MKRRNRRKAVIKKDSVIRSQVKDGLTFSFIVACAVWFIVLPVLKALQVI